jgi:hypothetical protein
MRWQSKLPLPSSPLDFARQATAVTDLRQKSSHFLARS